jgi:hypothetical protein
MARKKANPALPTEPEVIASFTAFGVTERIEIFYDGSRWRERYLAANGLVRAEGSEETKRQLLAQLRQMMLGHAYGIIQNLLQESEPVS